MPHLQGGKGREGGMCKLTVSPKYAGRLATGATAAMYNKEHINVLGRLDTAGWCGM